MLSSNLADRVTISRLVSHRTTRQAPFSGSYPTRMHSLAFGFFLARLVIGFGTYARQPKTFSLLKSGFVPLIVPNGVNPSANVFVVQRFDGEDNLVEESQLFFGAFFCTIEEAVNPRV